MCLEYVIGGAGLICAFLYWKSRTTNVIAAIGMMNHLASHLAAQIKNVPKFEVSCRDKTMKIEFENMKRELYTIYLPFDRQNLVRDLDRRVTVRHKDGTIETINHPPGMPLLVTHEHLDAEEILTEYD